MGFPCAQGNVWYVNLELDDISCKHRIRDVYTALGILADSYAINMVHKIKKEKRRRGK